MGDVPELLSALDAAAVRRWALSAAVALEAHRAEIDQLNVFPVPDADTGTNLALTIRAGADATAQLRQPPASAGAWPDATPLSAAAMLREFAHGALLGARGNSGVIVSEILRGLAEGAAASAATSAATSAAASDFLDAAALREGLVLAANYAYAAVQQPFEGTMLSVIAAAADATGQLAEAAPLATVVSAACSSARQALADTTDQLEVLARAGVVDAGGRGLVVLLASLEAVVTGRVEEHDGSPPRPRSDYSLRVARETGSDEFGYEVQYLLDAAEPGEPQVAQLRERLAALGDSLLVVGAAGGPWNVHVHTNDVGAVIEAGIEHGRPRRITVVRFEDQRADAREQPASVVIALAATAELGRLFAAEGVIVIEHARLADALEAVRHADATRVVLLPGAADTAAVAVVPTRSPVQALAAIAVHDPSRRPDDDVIAMAEAAAATRFAQVSIAEAEAVTTVGYCRAGDVLGLIDEEVVEIGGAVEVVAEAVLDRLLGTGGELVTILVGAGAHAALGEALVRHVHERAPLTEVTLYPGGQSDCPVLIGME
jgi:DAK2 domain fusion protein YloV